MRYCQGNKCHEYRTKDRIRGTKGDKSYQTRRRTNMYYGKGNFCSQACQNDWLEQNIEHALNHFGRTTKAKKALCGDAWYKDSKYLGYNNDRTSYAHFLVNDLLGERRPISEAQYYDDSITQPNNLSQ